MSRRLRWILGLAGAAGLVALVARAPLLLGRLEAFRVRRVEVRGVRYLAPHEVLEKSGITRKSSVFDDPEPWRNSLMEHPLVAEAVIEREFPGTVVLQVTEVEPVALVRTPELHPVDAEARVLPIDPAAADLDLPVVRALSAVGADGRLSDRLAVEMVRVIGRIRRQTPALAARVSEVDAAPGGGLRLLLREPSTAEVLLPADFGGDRLDQLRLTLADLVARREIARIRRIDVRFRDQVVVSLTPSADG